MFRRRLGCGLAAILAFTNGGCGSPTAPPGADARLTDAGTDIGGIDRPTDSPRDGAADSGGDLSPGVPGDTGSPPDAPVADGGRDVAGDTPPAAGGCRLCPARQKFCNGRCVSPADPNLGCGKVCFPCTFANAAGACQPDGSCRFVQCNPGFADCNGLPADGCEADLSDGMTCGRCGNRCDEVCTPAGCAGACTPPLTRCGTKCVDLSTSLLACGACGSPCTAPAGGSAACTAGRCEITCGGGLTRCPANHEPNSPIVCADTRNDPGHCGGCGTYCTGHERNAYGACSAGACTIACLPGWTQCGAGCAHLGSDNGHCGMCNHACGAAEYCTMGTCRPRAEQVIATGLGKPEDIAVDGDQVFFSTLTDGGIHRVAATGGMPSPLTTGQANPVRLAVDSTHVYWASQLGGAVMRVPRGGGTPEVVASAVSPVAIALDAQNVFWAERGGTSPAVATVKRAPKGANVVAQEVAPGTFTLSPVNELHVLDGVLYVQGMVVDAVPLDGRPVVRGKDSTSAFAIDAFHEFGGYAPPGFFYRWKSRSGDESGGTRVRADVSQFVATPCGALFPGGFLPLLPTVFNISPGLAEGQAIIFSAPPAKRTAYAAPYAYWTEPGDGATNGLIRRIRVPLLPP